MLITRTPVRISFLGGGSDYPQYLRGNNVGMVVGTAIRQYSYITCRWLPPLHAHRSYFAYSEIERVQNNKEVRHRVIRSVLKYFNIVDGIEICHLSDIPNKLGTGSSSTFLVGLIHAVATLQHKYLDTAQLIDVAIHIEQEILRECIGYQDSCFAAFGGLCAMYFKEGRDITIDPINIGDDGIAELESYVLLFSTGIQRVSHDVTSTYVPSLKDKEEEQRRMVALAQDGLDVIERRKFADLGPLLHESWYIKRSLHDSISNPMIDEIYERAMKAGALGGKLCGGGAGGGMVFIVHPKRRKIVTQALKDLVQIPFRVSPTGSSLIFEENTSGY